MKKLLFLLVLSIPTMIYSQDFEKGKTIFEQNCASCHKMDGKLVGPPLQNTVETQGREWTQKWIYNSQVLIEEGDAHANEIYKEYNQMAMPSYSWLAEDELSALVDYLEGWKTNQPVEVAEEASTEGGGVVSQSGNTEIPKYIWVLLIITAFIITLSVFVIIGAIRVLDKHFSKVAISNAYMTKKLDMSLKEAGDEADELIEREVYKRVSEKVKSIKEEIDDSLKNFK
jgi:cytochrome c551/c552